MADSAGIHSWDPFHSSSAYWNWFAHVSAIWWTRRQGLAAIDAANRSRFDAMVEFARRNSAFYRDAYRGLPMHGLATTDLPPVTKRQLMARFEDWVTDPAITRAGVTAFLGDPALVGERYLGRYAVWKSSGSTGEPGIFVQDQEALATYDALIAVQLQAGGLAANFTWGLLAEGGRAALIAATGGHFASIASWQRLTRGSPWLMTRSFSVMAPVAQLVAELNAYQPAFLASYPTVLALLAQEQDAGRLRIRPTTLWSGGECLAPTMREAIEQVFACPVVNEYGSSECMSIAFGCDQGWLHVNSDWVMFEPVGDDYRPTRPGEASSTVLLTNLANRVQPIIRYELGDSVVMKPEPCRCGNPLPAIQVEGRRDDVLVLGAENGATLRLLPMALTTVVEEASGVHRFQIIQTAPDRLALRVDVCHGREGEAMRQAARAALASYLASQGLANVRVALDSEAPRPDPASGKLRQVIAAMW